MFNKWKHLLSNKLVTTRDQLLHHINSIAHEELMKPGSTDCAEYFKKTLTFYEAAWKGKDFHRKDEE
jgi:hypothetical protein